MFCLCIDITIHSKLYKFPYSSIQVSYAANLTIGFKMRRRGDVLHTQSVSFLGYIVEKVKSGQVPPRCRRCQIGLCPRPGNIYNASWDSQTSTADLSGTTVRWSHPSHDSPDLQFLSPGLLTLTKHS